MLRESRSLARLDREGGWYVILRVPVTATDDDLTVALLERCSVLIHPGHFFNFSQEGFLILSLITPDRQFSDGVRRIRKILNGNWGNVEP
jgi:alanine-synthesizing transaminase